MHLLIMVVTSLNFALAAVSAMKNDRGWCAIQLFAAVFGALGLLTTP
jgi:hypothetical protein